jgi:hypothetical protein
MQTADGTAIRRAKQRQVLGDRGGLKTRKSRRRKDNAETLSTPRSAERGWLGLGRSGLRRVSNREIRIAIPGQRRDVKQSAGASRELHGTP